MPTYSEWLNSTRTLYTTAMTNAYDNRNNVDTTNPFYLAWQAMNATGDLTTILAPNTAFYGGSPDGDEADILLFQGWLQANPVAAGNMNLEPTLTFRGDQRSSLGNAGKVGNEQRRWKGNPVYTFANGIVIGKDGQIAAAIGTEGGDDLDGFGTDTIAYFDGVPFSTGTGVPGTTVFRGDTVVSGSIKGTGGVVIIDDVIQLETGVSAPAGIGVDADGKVRIRHRGEGFKDLIDEIATVQTNLDNSTNTAANLAKLWQGTQNTSSSRWGTSLIPNGNLSLKTVDPNNSYNDRLVGVKSVGTTSNIVSIPSDGVGRFDANLGGIIFQAVPVESARYAIRIRYRGGSTETMDNDAAAEGLYIGFCETTDTPEDMGDKTFIYDTSAATGTSYEGSDNLGTSEVYVTNTSVVLLDGSTSEDAGGNIDGVTIQQTYQVKSFVYEPSASAKSASLILYTRNYSDVIDIDYVVMTESPLTTTEVDGLITTARTEILGEIDDPDISVVSDPQMKDYNLWAGHNGATLANGTDGITGGDEAIQVSVPAGGGGIISGAIVCESDRYIVGAKVRVLSSVGGIKPNLSMFAIEKPEQSFPSFGSNAKTPLAVGVGNHRTIDIDIVKVDGSGDISGSPSGSVELEIAELDGSEPLYTTVVGTYEVEVKYIDSVGTEYDEFDPTIQTTAVLPGLFSLVIQVDTQCELSVDYVYGRLQGASVNIAQTLADTAYTDAHGFVTAMNEQLIKEQGSIITNAGMSILDSSGNPAGWRTDIASGTLTLDTAGDNAIRITQEVSQTGQRRLITPAFSLGTADKFSIGVRIRGINGSIAVQPKVAVTADNLLPSPYVTLAAATGGNTDVMVPLDVTETAIGSPVTVTDTVNHESILVTWNKGTTSHGGLASIIIEADNDFEVDFVFVKEQIVSYDLADAQAVARREEAIASAAGFVSNIGDSIAEESGSFITNAGFSSWYLDTTTDKQRPQKWLATRDTTAVVRVITETEVAITSPASEVTSALAKETRVVDKQINGSAIRFNPAAGAFPKDTGIGGILSGKFQLPVGSSWQNPATGAVSTTTGSYTLSVRLRLDDNETGLVGVRLYAHEYFSLPTGSEAHVFCKDGSYGSVILEGADRSSTGTPLDELKLFTGTDPENDTYDWGQVQRIKLINVATNDASVGYNPDDGTGNSADEYVEYLPHDNSEDDGDRDALYTEGIDKWYDISGTYKPHQYAKVVSFEILLENDAGTSPQIYVDYVSLITQPFDADFAETLADARATSISEIKTGELETTLGLDHADWTGSTYYSNSSIAELLIATRNDVDAVETALAAEDPASTLIPNSFFGEPETGTAVDDWLATRSTTGTITRTLTSANGSYGSYITLGSTPVGEEIHGMLSKAVPVIGDGSTTTGLIDGGLSQNPNFDLVIRYRADDAAETVSWQMIAHEFYNDSLTGQNQYVFENGYGNLSSTSGVEQFSAPTDGNAVVLEHIFTENDTDKETESESSSVEWLTLVGTYKPTANARWVSFEFVLNEDKDNNDGIPTVQIDGILLQRSTVDNGLASQIQAAAVAAQDAADAAQNKANTNEGNISTNTGNISSNTFNISTNASDITTNSSAITTIETSQALMNSANLELFLIQTAMANETDSKIANAGFAQPSVHTTTNSAGDPVTNLALPAGFLPFADTGQLVRVQGSDATATAIGSARTDSGGNSQPESVDTPYYDCGQNGFAMIVPGTDQNIDVIGFYTAAVIVPNASGSDTSEGASDSNGNDFSGGVTLGSNGQYTISFNIKNLADNTHHLDRLTVYVRAHEYDDNTDPATSGGFIVANDLGSGQGGGYNSFAQTALGSPTVQQESDHTKDNRDITIIKLSDATDTTFGSEEQLAQGSDWITIGGTYTASSTARCVSFSLWINQDDDSNNIETYDTTTVIGVKGGNYLFPCLAVDFIYCATQSFTADMAEQITASRVYTVQQALEADLTSLEGNIAAESDSLMPNGNFHATFTDSAVTYAKGWLPTGINDGSTSDKLRIYAADSASRSIGTYVKFNKNIVGGSGSYGANISGIISKSVLNPVQHVRDQENNIGSFNIGMRIRGTTDTSYYYSEGYGNQHYLKWSILQGDVTLGVDEFPTTLTPGATRLPYTHGTVAVQGHRAGSVLATAVTHTSVGHRDRFDMVGSTTNPQLQVDIDFTGKSAICFIFYAQDTYEDNNRRLYFTPFMNNNQQNSGYKSTWWFSTDEGTSWTKVVDGIQNRRYWRHDDDLYNKGNGYTQDYLVAILLQADDGADDTDVFGAFDEVRLDTWGYTGTSPLIVSKGISAYSWGPNEQIEEVPDFAVKLIAHESFEAISDPGTVVYSSNSSYINTSPATGTGIATTQAFDPTATNPSEGQSIVCNLIDMRYSQSTDGNTQDDSGWITIDATAVDDDTGESIQDWRNIVGSYTPSGEDVTGVSFEILVDHEKDGDSLVQEVWLDSITMAVSSISGDLASTISDNRIFVEKNFLGGSSVVDQNSVIFNGDFAHGARTFPDLDTVFPAGWYPWYRYETQFNDDIGINDATDWGFSENSNAANRIVGWTPAYASPANVDTNDDGVINTSDDYAGIIGMSSRPFKINSTKYSFRMSYRITSTAAASDEALVFVFPYMTFSAQDIAQEVVSILPPTSVSGLSNTTIRPSSYTSVLANGNITNNTSVMIVGNEKGGSWMVETMYHGYYSSNIYDPSGNDDPFGRVQVMDFDFITPVPTDDLNPIKWACFNVLAYASGAQNALVTKIEIMDVQMLAIGNPYGSGTMGLVDLNSPTFDSQKDPLPPIPRDTSAKTALINGTDIEIAAIPTSYSHPSNIVRGHHFPKGRLLACTPRKVYTTTSSSVVDTAHGEDGISYFYPGPSGITYSQTEYTFLGTGGDYTAQGLTFGGDDPSGAALGTVGSLQRVSFITFDKDAGETHYPLGSDQHDRVIYGIGRIAFDPDYEPSGGLGLAYGDAATQNIGSHIVGLNRIFLGPSGSWNTSYIPGDDRELAPNNGKNPYIQLAIKQQTAGQAICIINNGTAIDRWYIGESNDEFQIGYGENAADSVASRMRITASGDLRSKRHIYVGDVNGAAELIWRENTSYDMSIYQGTVTNHNMYFRYGTVWDYRFEMDNTDPHIRRNVDDEKVRYWNSFTGQHKSRHDDTIDVEQHQGLIVVATGRFNCAYLEDTDPDVAKPHTNDTHPIVHLSSKEKQKSVFGVVAGPGDADADGNLVFQMGNIAQNLGLSKDDDRKRIAVNSIGEGAIWVCNIGGNLENGDYITTSKVPGYGMLQDDDLLHNYTVAKITQDCEFELDNPYYDCVEFEFEGNIYRKAFVGCTYHCG